jgi:gamma-glutamyl:cysteine ligase YbdK (ATP-grasp superfamily)
VKRLIPVNGTVWHQLLIKGKGIGTITEKYDFGVMMQEPSFTIGIEEEYKLVDRKTRNLISQVPETMLPECEARLKNQVSPEFLQCQIEVGTQVCRSLGAARSDLAYNTGLKSYRIAIWNGMPRTGLPEYFDSFGEYQRHIEVLVNAGVIEDATKIWWDIRPSDRYPTLEMRISDVCTRLDDAIAVAAFYLCWLRMLFRLRRSNQRWRRYSNFLLNENRWRAHRYGIDEGLLDFGRGEVVPFKELIDEGLELIQEDAEYFDCVDELKHINTIIEQGTSAHRQVATYINALNSGKDHDEALRLVVDLLIEETLIGT